MSRMATRGFWAVLLILGLAGTAPAAPPANPSGATAKSAGATARKPSSADKGAADKGASGKEIPGKTTADGGKRPAAAASSPKSPGAAAPPSVSSKSGAAGKNRPAAEPTSDRSDADDDDDDDDDDEDDIDEELDDDEEMESAPAQPGTAEWYLAEASKLRLTPLDDKDADPTQDPKFQERQRKIVDLATKSVALTHKNPEKKQQFEVSARYLLDARLQLAMTGDDEQVELLYENARAFVKRDPASHAAAHGAHTLVNLAYHNATQEQAPDKAATWRSEFAQLANHYLQTFPREEPRSVPLAYTAGRLCEQHGQIDDARACYTQIVQFTPDSLHGSEAERILRRLDLVGNPPPISGPTLEGETLQLDDLLGKPVLVVFWSSEAQSCAQELPRLLPVIRQAQQAGVQVVGVALDTDRKALQAFVGKHRIDWTQLQFTDPEQQGWKNPVTTHFGVFDVPAFWLVDANGNAVSTTATASSLKQDLRQLTEVSGLARQKSAEADEVVPVEGTRERAKEAPASTKPATGRPSAGKGLEKGAASTSPTAGSKGANSRLGSR
jgi:peroxiredoxin